MIKLRDISGFISENVETIKNIAIIVIIVLAGIFITGNIFQKKRIVSDYENQITQIESKLADLESKNIVIAVARDSLKKDNQRLKFLLLKSEKVNYDLEQDRNRIAKERDKLKDELINIPKHDIYDSLNTVYYPHPGWEKIFPFSAPQITDIYWTAKNSELMEQEIYSLYATVKQYKLQISLKDSINNNLITDNRLLEEKTQTMEGIIDELVSKYSISEEQIKKLKRQVWLYKTGVIIAGGALIVVAVL